MKSTVRVFPNGDLQFLYNDDHPCIDIKGDLSIIRESNVDFDIKKKLWFMNRILADGSTLTHPNGFTRRLDAIAYEIELLEAEISNV